MLQELGEGFFGFVASAKVWDAINVADAAFVPACALVPWQVVDESCAVEGVEDGAGDAVGGGVVAAVHGQNGDACVSEPLEAADGVFEGDI